MRKNKGVIQYLFCFEINVCISLDPILTKQNARGGQRITYCDQTWGQLLCKSN